MRSSGPCCLVAEGDCWSVSTWAKPPVGLTDRLSLTFRLPMAMDQCFSSFNMNQSSLELIKMQIPLFWENQFPSRLIRSPGFPRRRKGSGALKMEIGVWNSQGGEKDKHFCPLRSLVLVNYTTQFKLLTRDYITMYPARGQFLLPENLLTNPDILECILWEWIW